MKQASYRRTNTAWFCLHEESKIVKLIKAESTRVAARGVSEGKGELFHGCEVPALLDE